MHIIRLSLTIVVILLYTACKKDIVVEPVKLSRQTFPIEYQFVNPTDENVKAAVFYTVTFYPNDTVNARGDSTSSINWYDRAFNDLIAGDTVRFTLRQPGYTGCTAQIKIRIAYKRTMFSPVLWEAGFGYQSMTVNRCYVGPVDTIGNRSQAIVRFTWPEDTLRFKEVKYF